MLVSADIRTNRFINGYFALLMVLAAPATSCAQSADDEIERIVVTELLGRVSPRAGPKPLAAINPTMILPGRAPAVSSSARRSARRHSELIKAVAATSTERETLIDCWRASCPTPAAQVLVSLSQPIWQNDTVRVTGVIESPARRSGKLDYEAMEFILVRRPTGWTIVKAERLGES